MATYALTSCTLSTVTDVKEVYTYYYLSEATETIDVNMAPKDNQNPPGAATITVVYQGKAYVWSLTEPTISTGSGGEITTSIGELYCIECVEFSDSTYDWGPLMTSSTYAAAKAAYNLSVQAKSMASQTQTDLAQLAGYFLVYGGNTSSGGSTPASANVIQDIRTRSSGTPVGDLDPSTNWGYNVHVYANGINLRYNEVNLSKWIVDTTNNQTGIYLYYPVLDSNNKPVSSLLGSSFTPNGINFYNSDDSSNPTLSISSSNGIQIGKTAAPHMNLTASANGGINFYDANETQNANLSITSNSIQVGRTGNKHLIMSNNAFSLLSAKNSNLTTITSVTGAENYTESFTEVYFDDTSLSLRYYPSSGTSIDFYISWLDDTGIERKQHSYVTAGTASSGTFTHSSYNYSINYVYDGINAFTFSLDGTYEPVVGMMAELISVKYVLDDPILARLSVGSNNSNNIAVGIHIGQQNTGSANLLNNYIRVNDGNVRIWNTEEFRALNEVEHVPGEPAYHNSLIINGRDMFGGGKVLWRSAKGYYVVPNSSVYLNEPISSQPHGIILAWSTYDPSPTVDTARNYGWYFNFIPKFYFDFSVDPPVWRTWWGQGIYVVAPDGITNNVTRRKYIYVDDYSISGHADNASTGTGYANNKMALRYVIGI